MWLKNPQFHLVRICSHCTTPQNSPSIDSTPFKSTLLITVHLLLQRLFLRHTCKRSRPHTHTHSKSEADEGNAALRGRASINSATKTKSWNVRKWESYTVHWCQSLSVLILVSLSPCLNLCLSLSPPTPHLSRSSSLSIMVCLHLDHSLSVLTVSLSHLVFLCLDLGLSLALSPHHLSRSSALSLSPLCLILSLSHSLCLDLSLSFLIMVSLCVNHTLSQALSVSNTVLTLDSLPVPQSWALTRFWSQSALSITTTLLLS